MVLLIIIPMKNGYISLGILSQHFQTNPYGCSVELKGQIADRCCTQRSGALTNQLRQRLGWTKYEDYNVLAPFVDVCWWKLPLVRCIISTYINHKHQWYISRHQYRLWTHKHQPSNKYQLSSAINISGTPKTNCFQKISRKSIFIHFLSPESWVTLNYTPVDHHPQMCRIQGLDSPAAFGRPLLMPQVSSDGLAMEKWWFYVIFYK